MSQTGSSGVFKVGALAGRYGVMWIPFSGVPVDGASGSYAGKAAPGSKLINYLTGITYVNLGTKAAPIWTPDGSGSPEVREVYNGTGVSIAAGKLVYLNGWNETVQLPSIALADADAGAGASTADYITTAAIADTAVGTVTTITRLTGQATNGKSVGDPAYLDTTAGGITLTAPTGGDDIVQVVGRVAVVHASAGVIAIDIQAVPLKIGTNELEDLAVTAAKTTGMVAGVGSYKLARGVAAITGSGDVVTGLATVVAVIVSAQDDMDGVGLAAVSATVGNQAGAPAAGSITIKAWKVTATGNATLIAASASKNINWIAIGT